MQIKAETQLALRAFYELKRLELKYAKKEVELLKLTQQIPEEDMAEYVRLTSPRKEEVAVDY